MVARIIDLRKGRPPVPNRARPLPLPKQGGAPRRQSPLRTRRRRVRLAVVAASLLLLALATYLVHFVSYIEPLTVERIRVVGTERIDPPVVETYVDSQLSDGSFHYLSRRNIFLYPRQVIEEGIVASFPRVKSAALSRDALFSRQLDVTIEEREPYALWCKDEAECYAMDESGYIFASAATTTHGEFRTAYVFYGDITDAPIGQRFISAQLPAVLALLRIMQQQTNLIPNSVSVLPERDFTITLEQGFYVKAAFGQEPATIARNLELVLSSEALRDRIADIEYIDLRFGNRVYYKMKGEEQANI